MREREREGKREGERAVLSSSRRERPASRQHTTFLRSPGRASSRETRKESTLRRSPTALEYICASFKAAFDGELRLAARDRPRRGELRRLGSFISS